MKFVIFYTNGRLEHVKDLVPMHSHFITTGLINFIIDIDKQVAITRNQEGAVVEVPIPEYK